MHDIIKIFAPEVIGKSPQAVWDGPWTAGYPNSFDFGFCAILTGGKEVHEAMGEGFIKIGVIPESGSILDIGCSSTSHMVFGDEITNKRVWGVDFASNQFSESLIPPERRIVSDVTSVDITTILPIKNFELVTLLLFARYISSEQALALYQQIRLIGKKILVADYQSTQDEYAEVLGQQREFKAPEEKKLLKSAGFYSPQLEVFGIDLGRRKDYIQVVVAE